MIVAGGRGDRASMGPEIEILKGRKAGGGSSSLCIYAVGGYIDVALEEENRRSKYKTMLNLFGPATCVNNCDVTCDNFDII